ncbi:hypothetical protein B566_EDAN009698 [Ephemera danica]|nr:hypothetical protein B566_EDAN009698 [Ephemera danica]
MISTRIFRYLQISHSTKQPLRNALTLQFCKNFSLQENFEESDNKKNLIIFNSVIERRKHKLGWGRSKGRQEKLDRLSKAAKEAETGSKASVSVAFKYVSDEYKEKLLKEARIESSKLFGDEKFEVEGKVKDTAVSDTPVQEEAHQSEIPDFLDIYTADNAEDDVMDVMQIGTADPMVPKSNIPCGGCGAKLHCQNIDDPGFVPKEVFEGVPDKYLRAQICQRCHFLKHYSTALKVNVSPEDYPQILSRIRKERALVLLVVDLMDFPCPKRPVCVVGNKVDLLPADSKNYLAHITKLLREEVQRTTGILDVNLKHVSLVSARTGYGIESLISTLHKKWNYKGDIYLVGCTNVGKSSLFNVLINSDLCKVKAIDFVQRATISRWPGTTLNLLKFPVLRPDAQRMFLRIKRLLADQKQIQAEDKRRKDELLATKKLEHATLKGPVGRTFFLPIEEKLDPFSQRVGYMEHYTPDIGFDPRDPDLREGKWCFDTPGTVQPDQVLNLLTEDELEFVLPEKIISPETFRLTPGQTLLTVFASQALPLTVCQTENADELYSQLLGTELLAVPRGDEERLARWPGLQAGPQISLKGLGWKESSADILLSSSGWVAVTSAKDEVCNLQAHTPEARGIYVRRPALLPFAVNRRGPKVRHTPTYRKFIPLLT